MKSNFQIIIPMSGFGERFRKAGYQVPKPLIEIDDKPIISYVIDLFPGELDFIFICNQEHLENPAYCMEEIIHRYCPSGRVIGIQPHKLGPIHAVHQIEGLIDLTRPTVVNYCDFTCYWDWNHFKEFVSKSACAGAIPAYKGFHPHTLGSTNYAYIQEVNGCVIDIQEKQPYTKNRMEEFASSGTYYFATGKIMFDAFQNTVEQDLSVGGEYYVSLAYRYLLATNQPVAVYPLQHFMQWGTPEDVAEYRAWSAVFRELVAPKNVLQSSPKGALIVPMAGLGKRFADNGYQITKPLILVSGSPMVVQAVNDLPCATHQVFILREDMPGFKAIVKELKGIYPRAIIQIIPEVTQGQACTAILGLDALEQALGEVQGPITIGACDNGALYEVSAFERLTEDPEVDIIVWAARGHTNAIRHPQMFGWINEDNGRIKSISVKAPLDSPATDPIVIGTFTFSKASDMHAVVERLIARDGRINGEFYLDSCINDAIELGLRCRLFEVDYFMSWGTPNDLRTFEYWQSCFHKWRYHPYSLENDSRVPMEMLKKLTKECFIENPKVVSCN